MERLSYFKDNRFCRLYHGIDTRLLTMAILLAVSMTAGAAWRVVYDPNTTAQVAANTASQKLIEEKHNARLDSMSAKQQKIMQYTATMQTIKELYKFTMENITGFGEETKYYGEICQITLEIMENVPVVLDYINHSPVRNYILCLSEIADVVTETESLVADFVDIVNNGRIRNPLREDASNVGDGHNLLNRYERLTLANKIYSHLLTIKYKTEVMAMMCQFCNGISDVLYAIDPQSWAAWFTGTNIVDGLINDWNSLGV